MSDRITFVASLPAVQSAIRIGGQDGARVQLEVPETEIAAVVRLLTLRGKAFRVTIEAGDANHWSANNGA